MNALVIGCGSIGTRHASNLAARDDVRVIVHDVDRARVESVADELGVDIARDLEEALVDGIDFALICTPPHTHIELTRTVIEHDAHPFVEKPLSHSLDGVDELLRLADDSDLITMVGCNMRFHPPVVRIQNWLDRERIGRLEFIRLRYGNYLPNWRPGDYEESYSADAEKGGGIILDAIHEVELASHWLGDITSVFCSTGRLSDLAIEAEDTAEIVVETEDREMAEVHLDYLRPERARTYELLGTEGMIRWEGLGKSPERSRVEYRGREGEHDEVILKDDLNTMYEDEMEHFVDCIKNSRSPDVDLERGAEALELALTAKRSSTTGRSEEPP